MIMTKIALQGVLLFLAFLVMLNGNLRGKLKGHIDAGLSIILVGFLMVCWILYGWKTALISVALCFIYAGITSPIARIVARKLFELGDRL